MDTNPDPTSMVPFLCRMIYILGDYSALAEVYNFRLFSLFKKPQADNE